MEDNDIILYLEDAQLQRDKHLRELITKEDKARKEMEDANQHLEGVRKEVFKATTFSIAIAEAVKTYKKVLE